MPGQTRPTDDPLAEVAELADAPDSKSGARKGMRVRLPPSAVAHNLLNDKPLQNRSRLPVSAPRGPSFV